MMAHELVQIAVALRGLARLDLAAAKRIEGRLSENPAELRPGMEGVGKIEIGRRNIAWIWLHPLADGARLWAWRWSQ